MIQPLALVAYEKLLPGSQLANRLRDLGYRVQVLSEVADLAAAAADSKPLLIVLDLVSRRGDSLGAIRALRSAENTHHVPVLAFGPEKSAGLQDAARGAGATVVTADSTILQHLEHFIEQALRVD